MLTTVTSTILMAAMFSTVALAQCPKGADSCVTIIKPTNGTGPGTTTETIFNNDAHAQAVSNITAAGTADVLTYFLIARPSMRAMHNLKVNQAEGQFTPVYEMLDSAIVNEVPEKAASITTMPTIKGYYLGETWPQFVNNSPYLRKRVASCASEKRPNPKRKVKKYEFNPCSDVWLMTDNPSADMTLDCVALGLGAGKDMVCQDFDGEVNFQSDKLVSLKVVTDEEWSAIYPNLVAKFGQPSGRDADNTLAIWSLSKFHVVAAEVDQGAAIAWMTPDMYKKTVKAQREISNTEKQPDRPD